MKRLISRDAGRSIPPVSAQLGTADTGRGSWGGCLLLKKGVTGEVWAGRGWRELRVLGRNLIHQEGEGSPCEGEAESRLDTGVNEEGCFGAAVPTDAQGPCREAPGPVEPSPLQWLQDT